MARPTLKIVLQDKGTLLIYVRDPLFSSSVRGYFDEDLLPQVFECFRKRVEITGTIHLSPQRYADKYRGRKYYAAS